MIGFTVANHLGGVDLWELAPPPPPPSSPCSLWSVSSSSSSAMGENYRNTQNSSGCGYSDDWYTEVGVVTVMTGIQKWVWLQWWLVYRSLQREMERKTKQQTNKQTTTTWVAYWMCASYNSQTRKEISYHYQDHTYSRDDWKIPGPI